MSTRPTRWAVRMATALVVAGGAAGSALAQPTAFTYQGQLKSGGQPATGPFDMQFKLFDAASGGNQLGSTVCLDNVNVAAGVFTVQVDFGQQYTAPTPRFLEIQLRPDSGLDCSNATGFAALSRQPLTAAPLASHSRSAYALDAPDGSPVTAVFVDNNGQVGIGTTSPSAALHVNGDLGVGVANIPAGLTTELGGTSTPLLNLDVNFRQPNHNTSFVGGAIRIDARSNTADPLFQFISRPAGLTTESNVLSIDQNGNARLGPTHLFVPGGEENFRIIRGAINHLGVVTAGTGFHVTHLFLGSYVVTFDTPFPGTPAVTATADSISQQDFFLTTLAGVNGSTFTVLVRGLGSGNAADAPVDFIAIGPR